jgi:hypothetical protein
MANITNPPLRPQERLFNVLLKVMKRKNLAGSEKPARFMCRIMERLLPVGMLPDLLARVDIKDHEHGDDCAHENSICHKTPFLNHFNDTTGS